MAVRQRGVSFQVSVTVAGTRYRKDFPTKVTAEGAEREAQEAAKDGRPPPWANATTTLGGLGTDATLSKVLEVVERTSWAQKRTRANMVGKAQRAIAVLGDVRPRAVGEDELEQLVEAYYADGNTGASINSKLSALKMVLEKALQKKLIVALPKFPWQPAARIRLRYYTAAEEAEMVAWLKTRGWFDMADMVEVAYDTGARRSELLGLMPSAIVDDGTKLVLSTWKGDKGEQRRMVPLTYRARDILVSRLQHGDRSRSQGIFRPLDVATFNYEWDYMRGALGREHEQDYVFHVIRHTYASRLVQRGVGLQSVKELMGHEDIKTTMRYAHLAPEHIEAALVALQGPSTAPQAPVVVPPRVMSFEEYQAWAQAQGVPGSAPVPAVAAE
jgi:site-specific recombinase XerD